MDVRTTNDRRTAVRRGASVRTYIYRNGERPVRCRASNLSSDGVFLHTGATAPRPGEVVSLVFTLEYDRIIRTYRRWARVAHASHEGIGVQLFRERPDDPESALAT